MNEGQYGFIAAPGVSGVTIKGLSIGRYESALNLGNNNIISDNYIGVASDGKTRFANYYGIFANDFNTISNNIISGGKYNGGSIIGIGAKVGNSNTVSCNLIGTGKDGNERDLGNELWGLVIGGSSNFILNNTISGNGSEGIIFGYNNANSTFNTVINNRIGYTSYGFGLLCNGRNGNPTQIGDRNIVFIGPIVVQNNNIGPDNYICGNLERSISSAIRNTSTSIDRNRFSDTPSIISLINPLNNASLTFGNIITLAVDASYSAGTITKVEYYNGSRLLGQSTVAPFSFNWTVDAPLGGTTITAKAYNSIGTSAVSVPVPITVTQPSDTIPDLIWRNNSTGANAVWYMNSDGTVKPTSKGITSLPADWKVVYSTDMDGDGISDLALRNPTNGKNAIWYLDNTGIPKSSSF
jgi:hypothetical protein